MKFCYTVHSDNTLMNFGLRLKLEVTKDSPGQLGNEVVIELNMITRIGMTLLNPEMTGTIGFDMKIK